MDIEAFSSTMTSKHNPLFPLVALGVAAILFVIGVLVISYFTGGFETTNRDQIEGKICGGIMGETGPNACPQGYYCKYTEHYPDATGTCTKR